MIQEQALLRFFLDKAFQKMIIDLSGHRVRDMVDDADIFRYHIFGEMIFAVPLDLIGGTFLRRCKRNGNMENTIRAFCNDRTF